MAAGKLLEKSDKLCMETIRIIINLGGFPDWDELMLRVGLDVNKN